ncbi:hypothetical protein PGTUg99_003367 [Puccinia graminis f. sp. tritici]|uniref:Uncharacterized protein n=1 Tax=Puccinia graminis f. sp. tritici TaxID=56615 RepID=A0A5B0S8Q3_PUCGR|nr:hypothetical protein PGTUg99_003367 [Puccinia graminis f. sp. tritici]
MSTRSNNPDLHGPLPPASRPRRSKSAGGTGQPPQADYDPKEASASLSRESDGGDIGRERLNHGSSYKSEHRDHTKDPKELGPSNSFCNYSPRSHGLGSSGAKNASPGHEPSDHSFGSDGRGSHSFNLFGGYPATPQIAGEASVIQRREDQTPRERAYTPLEEVHSSPTVRHDGRSQDTSPSSAGQSEGTPEANSSQGVRRVRQGLEPLDNQERAVSHRAEEKRRQEALLLLQRSKGTLQRPKPLETGHERLQHPRGGIPPHGGLDTKILTAILDSLELVSKNLSAIDSNAEENFKTIVHSLDLVSRNNKKNATSLSVQFDNMIRNPEMTKIIAENTAKCEKAWSKLTASVDKLNRALPLTTSYLPLEKMML